MTLRQAGVVLLDCDHRTPPAADRGFPYVAIPQIAGGRIDFRTARRISPEHFVEWTRRARPEPGDIVLSRRCNPGETAWVGAATEFALGQNLVLLRTDRRSLLPEFLRWVVRGPEWWDQIRKFLNVGAVFDSLRCRDVPEFRLTLPPLPEQRAIARILGALDDKIELNRRMNETLEAMARALFKSWFVDFDPVRAKAEGRETGLPGPVADLFPNRNVVAEMGAVPEGWRIGTLADIASLSRDTVDPGAAPTQTFTHYSLPAFDDGQLPVRQPGSDILSLKLRVPADAILASRLNPEIERVWLVDVPPGDLAICSTEFLVLRPRAPFGRSFVFSLARSAPFRSSLQSLVTGTSNSHQRARADAVMSISVVRPADPVARAFEAMTSSLFMRSQAARRESRALAALRDALLPKLLSGELRVPDAERLVEAAT